MSHEAKIHAALQCSPVPIETIAQYLGMSRRKLGEWCSIGADEEYVGTLRVKAATREDVVAVRETVRMHLNRLLKQLDQEVAQ